MKSNKTTKKTITETKKTAPAAKKIAKKAAPKTVVSGKKSTTKPVSATKKLTRIIAQIDVGWGNLLYVRGEGAGLSWEQGIPMICDNDTEWHWVAETSEPISFKFLINDEKWSTGENVTINSGDTHISNPSF